jgi:hypothetical protein
MAKPPGNSKMIPLLAEAEQQLEAHLDPKNRANYMKVVVAGMRAALDNKGPNGALAASLKSSPDPIRAAARGAIALVLILRKQSTGVMPIKAMVPAAMTLMFHALDLIDKAGIAKIGPTELVRATDIFTTTMFKKSGITPRMLQAATQKVHEVINDPIKVEQMKRAAGVVKHPNASEPTPLPGAE